MNGMRQDSFNDEDEYVDDDDDDTAMVINDHT